MTEPVIHQPFLCAEMIPPELDLVAEVRALNDAGVEIPWSWSLSREPIDVHDHEAVTLTFGVNNDVGMVKWARGMSTFVPADGTNTGWMTYHLAGFHESGVPPYAEVPVETVYAAVAEFLTTWAPPTCVRWKEAASLLSRFE